MAAETVVAVALPRSADLAVALLAVAKTGAAWLPLDPALAAGDLTTQAARSFARVLLTDPATAAILPAVADLSVIVLDDPAPATADDAAAAHHPLPAHPHGLFAVADTPLDGGVSAPVALTHRNLARFAADPLWRQTGEHTVLWHGPHTVEALALELWTPLLNGARVVVAPPGNGRTTPWPGSGAPTPSPPCGCPPPASPRSPPAAPNSSPRCASWSPAATACPPPRCAASARPAPT